MGLKNSVLKNNALGRILNRFGITALSKQNKNSALNEEIMVDKTSGEFLMKNKEGSVVSFDAIAKRKSILETASIINTTMNMSGDMYLLEFDHMQLPEIVELNTNLLENEMLLKAKGLDKILFHIDIDELIQSPVTKVSNIEPLVEITIHAQRTNADGESFCVVFTVTDTVMKINEKIIVMEDIIDEVPIKDYDIYLAKIMVKRNPNNTVPNSKILLHNIVVSVD